MRAARGAPRQVCERLIAGIGDDVTMVGDNREDECLVDLEAAGLVYSTDAEPGIVRRRAGRGFTYLGPDGSRVDDERTLNRIHALVVPPAWTDVWICRTAKGHVQATGRDARERKQYRYHDEWRRVRDESKFEELALMDRTLIRVGNEEYRRDNGTHGLTTLVRRQVEVQGARMRFSFTGKGGQRHEIGLTDRRLAALVRRCHELGGREVFTYLDDDDRPRRVDSADCNDYLRETMPDSTVKTFRTWGGSVVALESLAHSEGEPSERLVIDAIDAAATRLGNTRAVARRSYVHPAIATSFLDGDLDAAWRAARSTDHMARGERALLRLIT
jgi:DNA topoisomerase-1